MAGESEPGTAAAALERMLSIAASIAQPASKNLYYAMMAIFSIERTPRAKESVIITNSQQWTSTPQLIL
jgi:hypothetical protein